MPRSTDTLLGRRVATTDLSSQEGLSLVELMIALALGLLVTAAVLGIFLSGSRNYQQDDRVARMQENGRYALNVLSEELAMAGYWGGLSNLDAIEPLMSGASVVLTCGVKINTESPIVYVNNPASTAAAGYCIDQLTFRPSTDILIVKRVLGTDGSSENGGSGPTEDKVYLRTEGNSGAFVAYDSSLAAGTPVFWRFVPMIYYIRNEVDPGNASNTIPVLYRQYLDDTSLSNREQVVEGIENIQVEFGVNTGTGVNKGENPNYYTGTPTADELGAAVTARIYILIRSRDPDPAHTDTKSYQLGSLAVAAANDHYYRRVFTTTVALRNPAYLSRIN